MTTETIICVGLDHTSSDRDLRMLASMKDEWANAIMRRALALDHVTDAFVLSTCNRRELYASICADATDSQRDACIEQLKDLLVRLAWKRSTNRQCKITLLEPDPKIVAQLMEMGEEEIKAVCPRLAREQCASQMAHFEHGIIVRAGDEAASHLIEISMGLASAHVGDDKVLSQLRLAHKRAVKGGYLRSGQALDKLLRIAAVEADRMRSRNRNFSPSMLPTLGAVAGFLAQLVAAVMHEDFKYAPRVLVIGSGDEATLAAQSVAHYPCEIDFCPASRLQSSAAYAAATTVERAHPGREKTISAKPTSRYSALQRMYDIIICTEALEDGAVTSGDIEAINELRINSWQEHRPMSRYPESVEMQRLQVFDLTGGVGVEAAARGIKDVMLWDVEGITHHFGSSLQKGREAIEDAMYAAQGAVEAYEQWISQQLIAPKVKRACAEIDRLLQRQVMRVRNDDALSESQREDAVQVARQGAQRRKHEIVSDIRLQAGLPVKSRTLAKTKIHSPLSELVAEMSMGHLTDMLKLLPLLADTTNEPCLPLGATHAQPG